MLVSLAVLIVGFVLLVWSADRFVFGASAVARNFGISPMIIGLTIVAMGSSAPEIMVSATASMEGKINTAIGNAIGSNITNITLVLGLTALVKPLLVSSSTLYREMPIVVLMSLIAWYFLSDLYLSFAEGVILMALFFLTIGALAWFSMRTTSEDLLGAEYSSEVPENVATTKAMFWLVTGMILLPLSANILVGAAVDIATYFGLSELVIGLTIIAIGTSLPELAASIAGVMKGEDDMALGNIIGSNIFNILAVLAMPGLIAPGIIDENAAGRDIYFMLGVTVLLILTSFSWGGPRKINRCEGGLLFMIFLLYQYLLFFQV